MYTLVWMLRTATKSRCCDFSVWCACLVNSAWNLQLIVIFPVLSTILSPPVILLVTQYDILQTAAFTACHLARLSLTIWRLNFQQHWDWQ